METSKRTLISSGWRERILALHGRQAKPASPWKNGFKTFVQGSIMRLIFLITGPLIVWFIEGYFGVPRFHFPLWPAVIAFIILGALSYWCAWFIVTLGEGTPLPMDSTNRLVIAGPYRYIRNPMATTSLLQGFALGLAVGSPLILLYVYTGSLMWNYIARPWEEQDLERKFGEEYRQYKQNVRCWIPRLRPYSVEKEQAFSHSCA